MSSPLSSASSMWPIMGLWRKSSTGIDRAPLFSVRPNYTENLSSQRETDYYESSRIRSGKTSPAGPRGGKAVLRTTDRGMASAGDGAQQVLSPLGHGYRPLLAGSHVANCNNPPRELFLTEYDGVGRPDPVGLLELRPHAPLPVVQVR